MRPGQQQQHNKQRMRGRNNNGNRKGPNPLSRSFESNGPDVKIRGTAQHIADKYTTLARDAAASGDRVMAENYLQHAEHYGRIVAAAQGQFQPSQPERDYLDEDEDGFDGAEGAPQQPVPFAPQNNQHGQNQPPRDFQRDGGGQPRQDRQGEGRHDNFRENRRERFGNRDGQGRDFNRDGARDTQGGRPPQGTGPQPYPREGVEGEEGQVTAPDGRGGEGRREHRRDRDRQRFNDRNGERRFEERFGRGRGGEERPAEGAAGEPERRDDAPVAQRHPAQDAPNAGETPAAVPPPAAPVSDASQAGEATNEETPRRRTRAPRRADAEAPVAGQADEPSGFRDAASTVTAGSEAAADEKAAAEPKRRGGRSAAASAAPDEPEGEAAPKRKPGRPRKKKPDEDEGDLGKLPDFLLATNG